MKKYGYIRVSTKEQNPERQSEALRREGIQPRNIYLDRLSGKDFNRPRYQEMVRRMRKGDILVVKSIDRLGRNYQEILDQWRRLRREKEVEIEVLDFPLLNTNQTKDGLTGALISDLVLQILAYVAQTEREFIHQRQEEGIAIARAKGVRFGRRRVTVPDGFEEAYQAWTNGERPLREAAELVGMSTTTFYRRCKERLAEETEEADRSKK